MINIKTLTVSLLSIVILFFGCKKDDDNGGDAILSLRLTDAPGNYQEVNVDIIGVEVTGPGNQLVNIPVNAGIYNLLDFTNGNDTLIATGSIPAGKIQQVRLILGNNNSVMVDSVLHPLATPSAQQSGLKLQVHKTLTPGVAYMLLLDFDASKSIVQQGNGSYSLKPVIRVIDQAISGAITGVVQPPGVLCLIEAELGGVTTSTYTSVGGEFLLQGLPQGSYTVTITPDPPFLPVVYNNVNVTTGSLTDMGLINL
jgi:hypothetical protein